MSDGARHFIPRSDAQIGVWAAQFWQTADGLVPGVPIPQNEVDAVEEALAEWLIAWPALQAARAAYEAALREKDARRRTLEQAARTLARTVQAMPQITDADRAKFGIPLRAGHRAQGRGLSAGPSAFTTRPSALIPAPLIEIKHIGTLTHTLRIVDSATPLRRALPKGAKWAEVWRAVGGPTAEFGFYRITTKPLVRTTFDAADAGRAARYMIRWIGRGNTPGPWSAVASATVAA